MNRHPQLKLSNVIMGLSSALDLVNWFVVNHHRQVASFASRIGNELGLNEEDRTSLAIAAALHDIGAISFNEKFSLTFETDRSIMKHAELGYHLLSSFKPFTHAAEVVRYHHLPWSAAVNGEFNGHRVPAGSHILHLADRTAVLIRRDQHVLKQVKGIVGTIKEEKNRMFMPELVDVFQSLAQSESFWLEAVHSDGDFAIEGTTAAWNIELDTRLLRDLSDLFRMIIDFRSPLTATHSNDVAHLSATIARIFGFSELEAERLHIAGNLHDLGKLAVPVEVIEKDGPLSDDDSYLIRSHTFHTYRILKIIGGLDDITFSAALHHECLDGTGYPFRFTEEHLPLMSRIVAVADVLSALTENRSYRKAMECREAFSILASMANNGKLDPQIVELVRKYQGELRTVRDAADDQGLREFRKIRTDAELKGVWR